MNFEITKKEIRILSIVTACCGILLTTSGIIISATPTKPIIKHNYTVSVSEQKVAQAKTNEIKLKDMELEINNPISVNVRDYVENVNEIEESVLKALKLDTSAVNINQPGSYTYTIKYKKKKYNGTFVIKQKALPNVEITLKNLNLEVGSSLSTNTSSYIIEQLSDEVLANIVINLQEVNTSQPGEYQYTVTYNNKLYTAKILVYEKQTTIITPNTPETPKEEPKEPVPVDPTDQNTQQ